jgi:bifunctional non-homologous end joining protein LigD
VNTHCSAEVGGSCCVEWRRARGWRHPGTSTTFRALRLPATMQSRPGPLSSGDGWSFEPKYDGFRAVVSTERGLRVRSRRGSGMTDALPELQAMPEGLVLDGELVAWKGRDPYFPALCRRILNGDTSIRLTYLVFDLLGLDGTDLTSRPYEERRSLLEQLDLAGQHWNITEVFDDGPALYAAVCELGLEGVVAKRTTSGYGASVRGWVKIKNPNYWRRESEIAAMRRSVERRSTANRRSTQHVSQGR